MMIRAIFRGGTRRITALVTSLILVVVCVAGAEPQSGAAQTVVVVVGATSPLMEIQRLHLADLYLGRTTRLPDGKPAVPIDQKPGTDDRAAFSEIYLGRSEAQIKAHWSKLIFTGRGRPPAEAADAQAVVRMVAENPRAIGYVHRRFVDASVRIVRVN
jgi:ABC-type phosphate transport system substrate-binding protein